MAPVTTLQKPQSPRSGGAFDQRITLQVPYLCHRDSVTAQGLRMCFSSTCAMAAAYLKPGCLAGASQLDDRYLALLRRHGDTTDVAAQIQTLRGLGIEAELRTDGRIEQLIAQLRMGGSRSRSAGSTRAPSTPRLVAATGAWWLVGIRSGERC
ncbi:hypothetical protein LBMAG41_25750 [Cyanobium sp.]|nr:hypothetical protein LBMAG41_25750 [Cyanobium sp.]